MENCLEGPRPGSLIDIRRESQRADLKEEIIEGLKRTPKELPSIVLWNHKGIELYERLKAESDNYPSRHEYNLIWRDAPKIAAAMPDNGTLVELESGYGFNYPEIVHLC